MRLCLAILAGTLLVGARPCGAQVVQLPTFQFFTVRTAVSVPDSGSGYVGGVRRYANSSMTRAWQPPWRWPNPAARGAQAAGGAVNASATVIDHHDLDLQTRARYGGSDELGSSRMSSQADPLSQHIRRSSRDDAALTSVAQHQQRRQSAEHQQQQRVQQLLTRAEQAEAAGKVGAARVLYQMVTRRDDGVLGQRAAERLRALQSQ